MEIHEVPLHRSQASIMIMDLEVYGSGTDDILNLWRGSSLPTK